MNNDDDLAFIEQPNVQVKFENGRAIMTNDGILLTDGINDYNEKVKIKMISGKVNEELDFNNVQSVAESQLINASDRNTVKKELSLMKSSIVTPLNNINNKLLFIDVKDSNNKITLNGSFECVFIVNNPGHEQPINVYVDFGLLNDSNEFIKIGGMTDCYVRWKKDGNSGYGLISYDYEGEKLMNSGIFRYSINEDKENIDIGEYQLAVKIAKYTGNEPVLYGISIYNCDLKITVNNFNYQTIIGSNGLITYASESQHFAAFQDDDKKFKIKCKADEVPWVAK
jgi:hypothetical protein